MDELPVVGIVTRTKDRPVLLRRAVESVLAQTYPRWAQVIVNDGGDAGEVDELVRRYEDRAAGRISVLHNASSLGMQGASRIGLSALSADLLVIHDDDDSWAPEFLNVAVHELRRVQRAFPSTQGVTTYSHRVLESVRGNLIAIESVEPFNAWVPRGFLSFDRMLAGNFIPPISFVFTRKAYEDAGGLYEAVPYLGDWDFLIRVLSLYDVYMAPQFLAFYHWRHAPGQSSLSNTVTAEVDAHAFYRQFLLNSWLRRDLSDGRFGVGCYANLRMHIETVIQGGGSHSDSAAGTVSNGIAQGIVDYYWDSPSWKALRPLRSMVNRVLRRPPEVRPMAGTVEDAWKVAREIQESISWCAAAPVRWVQACTRLLAPAGGARPDGKRR